MRIVTVKFDYPGQDRYQKLLNTFVYSAKKNCPTAKLSVIILPPPKPTPQNTRSFASNTLKLAHWLRVLKESSDNVVFMDCDMIILRDISDAFNYEFDIGYTRRSNGRIPINGGVVFVRNNAAGISVIEKWNEINARMYADKVLHYPWRKKYAGMNQAAFGYLLERAKPDAIMRPFPCSEWNSCREDWTTVGPHTRVLHVKSELRKAVFGDAKCSSMLRKAVEIWRKYYHEEKESGKADAVGRDNQQNAKRQAHHRRRGRRIPR